MPGFSQWESTSLSIEAAWPSWPVCWLQKSIEIAADPVCREALSGTGWLSDMWGYAIAAAELGIHHHLMDFSQVTGSNSVEKPITHYCFPLMENRNDYWTRDTEKPILWSKWTYQPWENPPDSSGTTVEGELLLERLHGFVTRQTATQTDNSSINAVG